MSNSYFVYILTNFKNSVLYIGVTNNLLSRVHEHKEKLIAGFSCKYNLSKLVYYEISSDVQAAINREKYLKGKKRDYKIELIQKFNSEWLDLFPVISGKDPSLHSG